MSGVRGRMQVRLSIQHIKRRGWRGNIKPRAGMDRAPRGWGIQAGERSADLGGEPRDVCGPSRTAARQALVLVARTSDHLTVAIARLGIWTSW